MLFLYGQFAASQDTHAAMDLDSLKHAQRERIIFLDRCLTWRGIANRRDLVDRFGISMAQAALDFRIYLGLAHQSPPSYDPIKKGYLAEAGHVPLAPSSLTEAFDILLDVGDEVSSSSLPRPERRADPHTIARLYQAMRSKKALQVRYTSMLSDRGDDQWLAPVRFTSDGESVHLRAFSFEHREYRNYLPIRIEPDSSFAERILSEKLPDDTDWNTLAIIWLRPKKTLSEQQAVVVRREYGFDGALLRLETRKALEFFVDRRWGLDGPGARLEKEHVEYIPILSKKDLG